MNDISNKGAATSKSFWNTVKRFITNKILGEMFNKHYINIAEETPGIAQKI